MATRYHNLSEYKRNNLPSVEELRGMRFAIITSEWNENVTFALRDGAADAFVENNVDAENIDFFYVPGTFELTFAASKLIKSGKYSAIVAIGCVIQGDTPHFDYVCQGVTQGITSLNAQGEIPVIFSVLTTNNMQQALDRAGGALGNKGTEGAITALKMVKMFGQFKKTL